MGGGRCFCDFLFRFSENMIFLCERGINLLKSFLICRVKYCTQEGNVSVEPQSSHNNLDFGKESG